MSRVTIIYKSLPKYRIPFFEKLRPFLEEKNVELQLIYGQPEIEDEKKHDTGHIDWAKRINNRIIRIGKRTLFWQPCLHLIKDSDLVIVEQASKLLINYIILLKQQFGGPKFALWGHGKTVTADRPNILSEYAKRTISLHAHWWFAYNNKSATIIRSLGFPEERITIVQNTIDTSELQNEKSRVNQADLLKLRNQLNITGENVAIYAGGLYREKKIGFLMQAAREIREHIPDFNLLIIGAGPDENIVTNAANENDWIHYLGPKFNAQKVPFFLISKIMLLPSAVGLGIVDSFIFERPLITTDSAYNGPEIEYLIHGKNGLKLANDESSRDYAALVIELFKNNDLLENLKKGCRIAAEKYNIETMVEHFAEGVVKASIFKKLSKPANKGGT